MAAPRIPLAERMRPVRLDEVVGQDHLVGAKGGLTRLVAGGRLASIVLWGPPGTGKTTIARLLAQETGREFIEFSGAHGSAAEVKVFLQERHSAPLLRASAPVLFLDEIHRFNRSQQDILLPYLERGEVSLIGATTENPAFYLNPALRSRCQIFALRPIEPAATLDVLDRAAARENVKIPPDIAAWLADWSGGDLRSALSGLEAWIAMPGAERSLPALRESLGGRILFDRADGHYDLASAFQKSLRGSDADAALYYLSRMIRGGEDPRFIARRLLVTAAEDVGNADPMALVLAEAASRAVEQIGWPEARIPLAQAVVYVANAPKSNAAITGIDAALAAGDAPVPESLRDANTSTAKAAGRGAGYHYSHADYAREQAFLPDSLRDHRFYEPRRPQERSWRDPVEPAPDRLAGLWTTWTTENPGGGDLPLDAWAEELRCPKEALARALVRLARPWRLRRLLHADPPDQAPPGL